MISCLLAIMGTTPEIASASPSSKRQKSIPDEVRFFQSLKVTKVVEAGQYDKRRKIHHHADPQSTDTFKRDAAPGEENHQSSFLTSACQPLSVNCGNAHQNTLRGAEPYAESIDKDTIDILDGIITQKAGNSSCHDGGYTDVAQDEGGRIIPDIQRAPDETPEILPQGTPTTFTNTGTRSTLQSDLVDEDDVDWDEVIAAINFSNGLNTTAPQFCPPKTSQTVSAVSTGRHLPSKIAYASGEGHQNPPFTTECLGLLPLEPLARPPYPPRIRDRSPITGFSSKTLLRTVFRIGDLKKVSPPPWPAVAPNMPSFTQNSSSIIVELFARVSFSSRETLAKVQHFKFLDLYQDDPPYPIGVFRDWRTGSLGDVSSRAFLQWDTRPPTMTAEMQLKQGQISKCCRCLCSLVKDRNTLLGWALNIASIRETDWLEIEFVRQVVFRDMEVNAQRASFLSRIGYFLPLSFFSLFECFTFNFFFVLFPPFPWQLKRVEVIFRVCGSKFKNRAA